MTYRCTWCTHGDELMLRYHDEEWGVPPENDITFFEYLSLECVQTGLSWSTILHKREGYRRAFYGFDPRQVAQMTDSDCEALMTDDSIVRHRGKIFAIRNNARAYLTLVTEYGSFRRYLMTHLRHACARGDTIDSPLVCDALLKDFKKRGFSFVGTTVLTSFLEAIGVQNHHESSCFRYAEIEMVRKEYFA